MRVFSGSILAGTLLILLVVAAVFLVVAEPGVKGESTPSPTTSSEPCNGIMVAPIEGATNVPLNSKIIFSWTTSNSPAYVNLQLTPVDPIRNVTTLVLTVPAGTENTSSAQLCNQSFRYVFTLSQPLKPSTIYNATLFYGAKAQNIQSASWAFTTAPTKQVSQPFQLIVGVTFSIVIIVVAIIVALIVRRVHLRRAHTNSS